MEKIPIEVAIDIFSRLPADSVLQCKRVCKAWRSIINVTDHVFVDMHTRHLISGHQNQTNSNKNSLDFLFLLAPPSCSENGDDYQLRFGEFNEEAMCFRQVIPIHLLRPRRSFRLNKKKKVKKFQEVVSANYHWEIVGSSNGLVCLSTPDGYSDVTYICNPLTGEYVKLPISKINSSSNSLEVVPPPRSCMRVWFGFDPSKNEYKVVKLYVRPRPKTWRHVKVRTYTLGSGSLRWRSKGTTWWKCNNDDDMFNFFWPISPTRLTFLVNGVLYCNYNPDIVSFDLADDGGFSIVSLPPSITSFDALGVLGGCLYVTQMTPNLEILDIWLMEESSSSSPSSSWVQKFSISWGGWPSSIFTPLGNFIVPLESGKILLLCAWDKTIVSYDPKTGSLDKIEGLHEYSFNITPYVKSFVSLKALGEEDVRQVNLRLRRI